MGSEVSHAELYKIEWGQGPAIMPGLVVVAPHNVIPKCATIGSSVSLMITYKEPRETIKSHEGVPLKNRAYNFFIGSWYCCRPR